MAQETNGYRMKDLVNLSGVSKQTIHFYLREGLLPPTVRTSKNMAYYDESTVDDIRLIKELQEKRYLPLTVIREVLKGSREGNDFLEEDHLDFYEHLFGEITGHIANRQLDEKSFLAVSGLTENELIQLIRMGIISPSSVAGKNHFEEVDLAVTESIKELTDMGIRLQDIKLYGSVLQFARLEIELIHERIIHKKPEERHMPLMDIYSKLERLKRLLTAKAYREYFMNHSHGEKAESINETD